MKKCPYCAEEIQDEAVWCRFCKKKTKKSNSGGVILILVVVAGAIWLWNAGYLDRYLTMEETTCKDLQEQAIGGELHSTDRTKSWEIIGVRNSKEISRSDSKLVCLGELMYDGAHSKLRMELSEVDDERWIKYETMD